MEKSLHYKAQVRTVDRMHDIYIFLKTLMYKKNYNPILPAPSELY